MNKLQQEAMAYQRAQRVLDSLRRNREHLTKKEYKRLHDTAISGEVDGAEMQLANILKARRGL